MRVQAITTDVLRKFVAKRKDEDDVEGPTVNRNLAMIRRMFKLLRSTCRQDFSTAIYSIQQFFPEFCNQSPQWALRAALDAVNVEVHRSHKGAAQSLASLERTNRLTPKLLWV